MKCPSRRDSWVLSLQDCNIRLVADEAAAASLMALQSLFCGFVACSTDRIHGELIVSRDGLSEYDQRFPADLQDLRKIDFP